MCKPIESCRNTRCHLKNNNNIAIEITFINSSRRRGASSRTRLKSTIKAGDKTADSLVN